MDFSNIPIIFLKITYSSTLKILHALGLYHEHQRPDRNKYIYVNMTAIDEQTTTNPYLYFYAAQIKKGLEKACFLECKNIE